MSRRMPDPAGLIAGIAFTGIGLAFLAGEVDMVNRARWVWPIVLFSLGAGILAAVLRRPSEEAAGGADASADHTSLSTDVSGSPAWPGTEEQPAPEKPAGAEAWPAAEAADEQPAAAPVPTEPSEAPAHAESTADAEAEPVVEEPPGAAPESVPDEEPGVVEEPAPASGSAADEDGEEAARRQPGGPPA
jgi:outer membrane biosynthesis protein TonB